MEIHFNFNKEDKSFSFHEEGKQQIENKEGKPKHIMEEFKYFMILVPPARLNRNLRKLLVDYLYHQNDDLPEDFNDYLKDLYYLMEFLDKLSIASKELHPDKS